MYCCSLQVSSHPCRLRLNRRFIVVEGISQNLGDIPPLDQIIQLKEKFKYRLVLDESLSFGVLGATGRGAAEHFGIKPEQVEIVAASMGQCSSCLQVVTLAHVLPQCLCRAGSGFAVPMLLCRANLILPYMICSRLSAVSTACSLFAGEQ